MSKSLRDQVIARLECDGIDINVDSVTSLFQECGELPVSVARVEAEAFLESLGIHSRDHAQIELQD